MKKPALKKIKNSVLLAWFFLFVFLAIVIALLVKTIILIQQSRFDNAHQFILEVTQNRQGKIIAFNPIDNTISVLEVTDIKQPSDIQKLHIPIDAQFSLSEGDHPKEVSSLLFMMIFQCSFSCKGVNSVDAVKLFFFAKGLRSSVIRTGKISFASGLPSVSLIQSLFIDDTLYHEALSVSIINASGQPGLGNTAATFLSNIGGNVISVSAGNVQEKTMLQSVYGKEKYTLQRLQQVLHAPLQKLQSNTISDIVLTIGQHHPEF